MRCGFGGLECIAGDPRRSVRLRRAFIGLVGLLGFAVLFRLIFFRSVQRMLEGAIGMPNGKYRAMSFAHDPLRHAPHQYVRQAAPSMGSEHNQVSALAMRSIDDLEKGRSYFQQAA